MSRIFNFMATGVGSLPLTDAREACELVFQYLEEAPHWPQLPKIGDAEGMLQQFTEGMPGLTRENGRVFLRHLEPYDEWERFYTAYEEGDLGAFSIGKDRAQGLHRFMEELSRRADHPRYVKGQVTGPITLGLSLRNEHGASVFFDGDLRDMLVKLVAMKAQWQEELFRRTLPDVETIMFIDEPTLTSYGSAFMNVNRDSVIAALAEVAQGLQGLTGVHICGTTDWPMIMEVGLDIINFDAFTYLSSFVLYPKELKEYLERGGAVAWGIVPTNEEALDETNATELVERLGTTLDELVAEGIQSDMLCQRSLVTPSCGVGSLSGAGARRAYEMTHAVSTLLRARFGGR